MHHRSRNVAIKLGMREVAEHRPNDAAYQISATEWQRLRKQGLPVMQPV